MPPRSKARYTSLLRDDGFTNLSLIKVRRLLGIGLAEMLGVSLFLATGCGNVVKTISNSEPSHINSVLSVALGISASIIIFAPISGCMLNPCLNVTWVIMGHMSLIKFVYYTVFQVLGAYLGVAFIAAVTPNIPEYGEGIAGFCTTHPNPDVTISQAFAVEFFMGFFLSLCLCHVLDKRASEQHGLVFAKFAVIVVALALPLAKYEGGSANPARSLGPALLSGDWEDQWLYWTAPNIGAGVAALIYRAFFDAPIYEEVESDGKRREVDATI
ncbi:hypothetical protein GE061_008141 [Apolygus lucorum]|uniref:Aquaporin n=1 Tax=Apolygus lucorum TaxID=248454 RepID=A0A8S9WP03_APOLU|nr:hypothetical protein GE061_008141 [Apolygus lucorum]